ncbi:MSMEG_0565 family glycosyltransferase [Modestobacter roseus]|uniref:Glycosyltransferase-like protein n=1 Tax=Modestobacter roseus TaxID=1181884 RepID=A0A562IV72_9ACTN|nr:MSMEG_0565 family glycosyltransferase [Modestobacter roseus]MQA33617.1 MSMEG_0565 family glycosyltransferase [Modestobacter roseus]TWH74750.1 glycosyltransferase-like protein [Modestobacter roseus]
MRISLLTYSTRPRGGVVHTLALAEALARAGQQVTVWSLGRGGDAAFFRPVAPAVRLRLVPFPDVPGEDVGARILRSIEVLGAAFTAGDADVVHAQDCISANAVGDCVRTVHHLDTFTTPELAACHERAVVAPRALVCVSAAVAAEVATGWGRVATVIPNGVDAGRFAAAAGPAGAAGRRAWRERLGRYVLAVGGIEPRKGTLDLVEAFALVQRQRPELSLVVAGGETLFDYRDYRTRVFDRAAQLGVAPVVLGPVDHDALPTLVAAAEAFAFPSTKEGFGLAAMEALAAGVPVVTRDLPVLREVFDGAAAFADDPAGLAAGLLAGGSPAQRAAGRALAAGHSWDAAARAHLDLYRSL